MRNGYYTVEEAAKRLTIHPQTLYRLLQEGKIEKKYYTVLSSSKPKYGFTPDQLNSLLADLPRAS